MKDVFNGNSLVVSLDDENNILFHQWEELELSENEYKSEMMAYLEVITNYACEKILIDHTNYTTPLSENVLEWLDKNVHCARRKAGIKYEAIVVPSDMYKTLREGTETGKCLEGYTKKFFTNHSSALEWLIEIEG